MWHFILLTTHALGTSIIKEIAFSAQLNISLNIDYISSFISAQNKSLFCTLAVAGNHSLKIVDFETSLLYPDAEVTLNEVHKYLRRVGSIIKVSGVLVKSSQFEEKFPEVPVHLVQLQTYLVQLSLCGSLDHRELVVPQTRSTEPRYLDFVFGIELNKEWQLLRMNVQENTPSLKDDSSRYEGHMKISTCFIIGVTGQNNMEMNEFDGEAGLNNESMKLKTDILALINSNQEQESKSGVKITMQIEGNHRIVKNIALSKVTVFPDYDKLIQIMSILLQLKYKIKSIETVSKNNYKYEIDEKCKEKIENYLNIRQINS